MCNGKININKNLINQELWKRNVQDLMHYEACDYLVQGSPYHLDNRTYFIIDEIHFMAYWKEDERIECFEIKNPFPHDFEKYKTIYKGNDFCAFLRGLDYERARYNQELHTTS